MNINQQYLQHMTVQTVACHLLTVHNLAFQARLMREMRESISAQQFPQYVQNFFINLYPEKDYPKWIVDALSAVNISLL